MRFRFPCLVQRHVSERVTLTPLDHPELALHSPTLQEARQDLTLALDDRIARAHPSRVAAYVSSPEFDPLSLTLDAIPLWTRDGPTHAAPLRLSAVTRAAHGGFNEVHVPRVDLRLWIDRERPPAEQVEDTLRSVLERLDESARLDLRDEGDESIEVLDVDASVTALNSLQRRELRLDERSPSAPDDPAEDDWNPREAAGAERRADARVRTPTLSASGVALHRLARRSRLDPVFARDALVRALCARVEAERPDPVVLLGEHGVGKSALLRGLAYEMARRGQRARPVFSLDASRIVAGDGAFGAWEAQLHRCLDEARRAGAVLLLGQVADLLDAGRSAHSDHNVAQVLGPALAARDVSVIAEATPAQWATVQRRNQSFAAVWAPLHVDDPSEAETLTIVRAVAARACARRGISIDDEAVATCVGLVRRFWPYGAVVGNAVAFASRLIASRHHAGASRVSERDATGMFSAESGVALALIRDEVALDPDLVRASLGERVRAQPDAVTRAAQVVSVLKAGLSDRRRPVATLFFAGPTGVGKTELAKALAAFLFGASDRLVRVDMGEFLTGDAVARLLGDAREAGLLPRAVRRQPFCVVLLDEVEKAHPAVFDALLGVLGEARLTDPAGRVTDFRNAVIVMTSNLGADSLRAGVGFGAAGPRDADASRAHYLAEVRRFFRPELFNRLDEVVVFSPLGDDAIREITRREVAAIRSREGLRRRDIELIVDDAALDHLAGLGFDPRYGARPLKRALERTLVSPIARWLSEHPQGGAARVSASLTDGALSLRATSASSSASGARGEAEEALGEASMLRAELRRWSQSPAAQRLREQVRWHDVASRSPAFWQERSLADLATQRVAVGRGLIEALDRARASVEASEDLAFEAWYARDASGVGALRAELALAREGLRGIATRLYLAAATGVRAGALYVTAPRGSWHRATYLLDRYAQWAKDSSLRSTLYVAEFVDPAQRLEHPGDSPEHAYRWVHRVNSHTNGPHPAGAALLLDGDARCELLAGESGVHHFHDGSQQTEARVRWKAFRGVGVVPHESIKAMISAAPKEVIRRYQPGRERVRDLRMGREFIIGSSPRSLPLDEILDAWAGHCAHGGAEP